MSKSAIKNVPQVTPMSGSDVQYTRQWFDEYVEVGGMPESLMMGNHATRVTFLQGLTHTVVFRDVIQRFELTNPTESRRVMQMALQLMGGLTSFSKLKQRMAGEGYRISTTMVSTDIAYFEDAYLIYTVEIFSMHMAVRSTNLKKFYCSDHALVLAVAEKAGPDLGAVLENILFLHLRRGIEFISVVS